MAAFMMLSCSYGFAAPVDLVKERLDVYAAHVAESQNKYLGYPANHNIPLEGFYRWLVDSGAYKAVSNNAGDPFHPHGGYLNALEFEREVIETVAPYYGFDVKDLWGLVSFSGTDSNNHGIYFGAKYLEKKTGKKPVMYVSDAAHYSNMRLADLQNLDLVLVPSDVHGRMIPEELEKGLDLTRPALLIYAMGSTFKGAIDDQEALNAVLDRHPEIPAVYRHVDAALFGGYLPFTDDRRMVSQKAMRFESIAISGHKFFGIDSPCGLFLCTRDVYDNQADFNVTYLNSNMRMINCSRDALQPLKFWWLIQTVGYDGWAKQARQMRECTAYLKQQLDAIHWPCWVNQYSNTVFFRRPLPEIVRKYTLAQGYDDRFGGELAHVVVMQHVTKEKIDQFIKELKH